MKFASAVRNYDDAAEFIHSPRALDLRVKVDWAGTTNLKSSKLRHQPITCYLKNQSIADKNVHKMIVITQ